MNVPKEILSQHVAVLGKTRSGKSSVMRGLVEGLLERELPVCIVDPKGDWYGIKLSADGKRAGYPVIIFGGEHADIPINEHAGAHVAELFATGNRPCLIDLGGWMVAPRTRFWIDFASTLFKHTKGQRWLAVDEVHNFGPKGKVFDADAGKALHWTNRLASEGLGKGLAMLFASQRPQKVHNDTLTSAETLIAMRVLHPSDRGAVSDWIKGCGDSEGSEVLNSLAQMERGEGWVWSPEIGFGPKRVKFPMFKTYDSFRPQSIEDSKRLKGWAEVNLDEVRAKMAATIEKAKADDPKLLRARIAELERAAKAAPAKTVEKAVVDQGAIDRAIAAEQRKGRRLVDDSLRVLASAQKDMEGIRASADRAFRLLGDVAEVLSVPARETAPVVRPPVPVHAPIARREKENRPPAQSNGHGTLSRGQQKIVNALAELAALGVDEPSRKQLGMYAGYNLTGGSGAQHIADLIGAGLTEIPVDGVVRLTENGHRAADSILPPASLDELHNRVRAKLSSGQVRILDHLISIHPEAISRADLGAAVDYNLTGGSGAQHVADLVNVGAVTIPRTGAVVASELLFPEGLR